MKTDLKRYVFKIHTIQKRRVVLTETYRTKPITKKRYDELVKLKLNDGTRKGKFKDYALEEVQ